MKSKRMRVAEERKLKELGNAPASLFAAVNFLKSLQSNFDQSLDVSIGLGIDAKKSDQTVRGFSVLPHGTGRSVRVAVFAQGELAKEASEAGADIVGWDDLSENIKNGIMDFDVLIATTDSMPLVSKLGQILGPKGLMPNPKVGTVTNKPADAVSNAKKGQVSFRADKGGIVHSTVGRLSFSYENIRDNIAALIDSLVKLKPSASKGVYLKNLHLSVTIGPSVKIDLSDLGRLS